MVRQRVSYRTGEFTNVRMTDPYYTACIERSPFPSGNIKRLAIHHQFLMKSCLAEVESFWLKSVRKTDPDWSCKQVQNAYVRINAPWLLVLCVETDLFVALTVAVSQSAGRSPSLGMLMWLYYGPA